MRPLLRAVYRAAAAVLAGTNLERFKFVRQLNRSFTRYVRQPSTSAGGHRFRLDSHDSLNLSVLKRYESAETQLIKRVVQPGAVAIDIGAHIGVHTLQLARAVGSTGRVYAFEAHPDNYALLCSNIGDNNYQNVTTENLAVADVEGEFQLFTSPDDSVDHRLFESPERRDSVTVRSVTLDRYFADNDTPIDFIKMDVQGAEIRAIEGMRRLLERQERVALMTEFWPYGLATAGGDGGSYLRLLASFGFAVFSLQGRKWHNWVRADEAALAKQYTVANQRFTTLYCTKDKTWSP